MVKFTGSQIQFLMTKMTISDINEFNLEASMFVPFKNRMGKYPQKILLYEELLSLESVNLNKLKEKYFLVLKCYDPEQCEVVQRMFPDGRFDIDNVEGLFVDCKGPYSINPEDLCKVLKKDGNFCYNKNKSHGVCGRHLPKLPPSLDTACSSSDI